MKPIEITRQGARRFLTQSLQLGPRRSSGPTALKERIAALEAVQIDPVARVGRNQDLALYARSPRYQPSQLDRLLTKKEIFEYRAQEACVLPMGDYPLFKGNRTRLEKRLAVHWNRYPDTVRHVLDRLESEGPLPSRAFVSEGRVMGYWDTDTPSTKETSLVLNLLADAGRLMVVRREGTTRFFDLAERVVPSPLREEALQISGEEADDRLFDKYFRAYRLVRGTNSRLGWSARPMAERRQMLAERIEAGRVVPVQIEGVKALYYVLSEDVDRLALCNRAGGWTRPIRFLPPLDNLLWDRDRLVDLFDFYYRWEVYVPPAKREFGVYAMPILAGDRLVGRVDPEIRRDASTMLVHNVRLESWVSSRPTLIKALDEALANYAERLGAPTVVLKRPWTN
jgi:uncharacterized protein YcaQ